MSTTRHIHYLPHNNIDKQKWDACIAGAPNGLIYAYSFYLDAMCTGWDGLVLNDYEAVMPLPFRKKYGINYLYQPFLTAQLGLFGHNLSPGLLHHFLQAIPSKFRYWDMTLNFGNLFPLESYPLSHRKNFILDLHKPYEALAAQYRDNTKRNIKKSFTFKVSVKKDLPLHEIIGLNKEQAFTQGQSAGYAEYDRFIHLFESLKQKGQATTYGVYATNHQLLASVAFLFSHNRAYYLLVGNHPNSRALGASHRLIDAFIQDHAHSSLLLDFEGSDIPSLAFFYSSFGAREEAYSSLRLNRLPWFLKWLKN